MAKNNIITSITVPIDYKLIGEFELRRLSQIVKRDTHVIGKYLGIIQFNQQYLLSFNKGQYTGKLDELTLSTGKGRIPQHDLKKQFVRISHNELGECRDMALGMFKSYLALKTENTTIRFPILNKLVGRQINSRRWKLDLQNRTIEIMDSMDTNPKMIKEGKRKIRHNYIQIPLKLSKYHLDQMELGKLRTIQIVSNDKNQSLNQLSIKFSIQEVVEQLPRNPTKTKPIGIVGVDLGINIEITTALLTPRGVTEYKTFKVDENIKKGLKKTEKQISELQRVSQIRQFDNFIVDFKYRNEKLRSINNSNSFNINLRENSIDQLIIIENRLKCIQQSYRYNKLNNLNFKSIVEEIHSNRNSIQKELERLL
ncbi:MAG: hypothetical protein ACW99A_05560, partial [Candidatus Kariarchaeaceae archaeon]